MTWHRTVTAVAAAVVTALTLSSPSSALASPRRGSASPPHARTAKTSREWTGTWATAQHASYDPGTSETTVRMPVHVSVGGSKVRIHLTNGFTTDPLTIGHATVALRSGGAVVRRLAARAALRRCAAGHRPGRR
ncbi:hypothetical protein GCM10029978_072810 [Actinoallomurus acanthiterrae]